MIQVIFNDGQACQSGELWQWDYGQVLEITGLSLSRAEVHFCLDGRSSALIVPAQITDTGAIRADIPNKLLESGRGIKIYVYVADAASGETVRYAYLNVRARPKPEDYDAPADKNLLRQVMEALNMKADDLKLDDDGYLQLLAQNELIGTRVRLPSGGGGREIELRNNGTAIQWRYTDSNEWTDLVRLDALKGDPGETPEFQIRGGHLIAIYQD